MRFSELQPSFKKVDPRFTTWKTKKDGVIEEVSGIKLYLVEVGTIEEADGVWFLCPKCLRDNSMSVIGVHSIACYRPKIEQQDGLTGPGRWELVGTSFEDLSLVANPTSVWLTGPGCGAHFTVSKGEIIWNA